MSRVDQVPGTKPGHRFRNAVVAVGYVFVVFPIVVAVLPLLAVGTVASNYRESAAQLSRLPGVDSGGGLKAGFVAGAYAFVFWGVILSAGSTFADSAVTDPEGGDVEPEPTSAPNETVPTDNRTDGEATASDEELVVLFETQVKQWGVEITATELTDGVLYVEYYLTGTTDEEVIEEMAYILGAYVDIVDDGLEAERMEVTALDPDDDSDQAYWHVETEWAEEYNAGERTEEDVLERVVETFEATDK